MLNTNLWRHNHGDMQASYFVIHEKYNPTKIPPSLSVAPVTPPPFPAAVVSHDPNLGIYFSNTARHPHRPPER